MHVIVFFHSGMDRGREYDQKSDWPGGAVTGDWRVCSGVAGVQTAVRNQTLVGAADFPGYQPALVYPGVSAGTGFF